MNFFRFIFGLPMAAAVTVILFFAMAMLIKKEADPVKNVDPPKFDFVYNKAPPPQPIPRPNPVGPEDPPPTPITTWPKPEGGPDPIPMPNPSPVGPTTPDIPKTAGAIIRIPPAYPENCRAKGIEGAVIVQFDVTDRGEVTNVRIMSSDSSCFDRAVIKAVLGWKYPPRAQYGVVERFSFELQEQQ